MNPRSLQVALVVQTRAAAATISAWIAMPHAVAVLTLAQASQQVADDSSRYDAWIIGLPDDQATRLMHDLDTNVTRVLVIDALLPLLGTDDYDRWAKRNHEQVLRFLGRLSAFDPSVNAANKVVLLGASMGGPDSIREFLKGLDPVAGVAYVYAQHIGSEFEDVLEQLVVSSCSLQCCIAADGMKIGENRLYIVPTNLDTTITSDGYFVVNNRPWIGEYAPSIDRMMIAVARAYKEHSMALIFSGMGQDGAQGARFMIEMGYEVIAQSADGCQADSMPQAVSSVSDLVKQATPIEMTGYVGRFAEK